MIIIPLNFQILGRVYERNEGLLVIQIPHKHETVGSNPVHGTNIIEKDNMLEPPCNAASFA